MKQCLAPAPRMGIPLKAQPSRPPELSLRVCQSSRALLSQLARTRVSALLFLQLQFPSTAPSSEIPAIETNFLSRHCFSISNFIPVSINNKTKQYSQKNFLEDDESYAHFIVRLSSNLHHSVIKKQRVEKSEFHVAMCAVTNLSIEENVCGYRLNGTVWLLQD